MNNGELEQVTTELQAALVGQRFGRVFPLTRFSFVIDFRLSTGEFLFVSAEPGNPRAYLVRRRVKDLEKQASNPSQFVLGLRKRFAGAELKCVSKLGNERVLVVEFIAESETGRHDLSLVFQLTGRSANIFVIDESGSILDRLRETTGTGQEFGTHYSPPSSPGNDSPKPDAEKVELGECRTLSEKLDRYYQARDSAESLRSLAESARKKLRAEILKKRKLADRLQKDLEEHGNADQWKRCGDLLLANVAKAKRDGDRIIVIDYYDPTTPEIEIEGDPNLSVTEIAENYFKRYTKARNAANQIARRLVELDGELARLRQESDRLEEAIFEGDESYFSLQPKPIRSPSNKTKRKDNDFNGARRFWSTDGYEILVGKKARDNDHLTFRMAKSFDLWLHAADYPGSHVVVRNRNRKEIPHATLIEAAELAAFYSDAREQPKAAVNYTQKKFVNKPKGAAPGLVSLASFKTILVQPRVGARQGVAT